MIDNMEEKDNLYQDLSDTIKMQIEKLDNLDTYTSSHVHNVPQIAKRICEKLELSKIAIMFCVRCAYLHDIGKIFIPQEILQKKDQLTDEEFEIMKTHTTKGYDLCKATEHLVPYARAARSHHENKDGSGYPDRLKDNEIPTEAEIIKLADVYDALISRRQYRVGYNRKTAIQIIREEMDKKHLNRKVFRALMKVILDDIEEDKKKKDRDLRTLLVQQHYINNILEIY